MRRVDLPDQIFAHKKGVRFSFLRNDPSIGVSQTTEKRIDAFFSFGTALTDWTGPYTPTRTGLTDERYADDDAWTWTRGGGDGGGGGARVWIVWNDGTNVD